MPIFKIHHITRYQYDRPVIESVNEIKIYPFDCHEQEVLSHELDITGNPEVQVFNDYWGNKTGVFDVPCIEQSFVLDSKLKIRTTGTSQIRVNFQSGFQQLAQEACNDLRLIELATAEPIDQQVLVQEIIEKIKSNTNSIAAIAERCAEHIYKYFAYTKGITNIETTVDEILTHKGGVCQDFAHLMLQIMRSMNIPSRYVSGYICPNKNGLRGEGATHAWVEVYIPQYGWAGIDPTNNIWVTTHHVKLAVGRHFIDCTPVKGIFKGAAKQKLSVYVSVGYEDGHTFEEVNNVQMQYTTGSDGSDFNNDILAGHQQQ